MNENKRDVEETLNEFQKAIKKLDSVEQLLNYAIEDILDAKEILNSIKDDLEYHLLNSNLKNVCLKLF